MKSIDIETRRTIHLKREAFIGFVVSLLSVFIVLPYLDINSRWTLPKLYLELFTTPLQMLFYFLLAVLITFIHLILTGLFYNVNDISPKNVKSTLINQVIYGTTILGFAYFYCSRPSKLRATLFERFIDYEEHFYITLFFILFYWAGNMIYFNSKYFKRMEVV